VLKKPSELFEKKEEKLVDQLLEESQVSSNAVKSFRDNVQKINSLSDFSETLDNYQKSVDDVSNLSKEVETLREDIKDLLTSEDLDRAMMGQIVLIDKTISDLQENVKSINEKKLKEIRGSVSSLTDSVNEFLEVDAPKYKRLLVDHENRSYKRYEDFEETVNTALKDVVEDIDNTISKVYGEITSTVDGINEESFKSLLEDVKELGKKQEDKYKRQIIDAEVRVDERYVSFEESVNTKVEEKYNILQESVDTRCEDLTHLISQLTDKVSLVEGNNGDIIKSLNEKVGEVLTIQRTFSDLKKTFTEQQSDLEKYKEQISEEVTSLKADVLRNETHIKNQVSYREISLNEEVARDAIKKLDLNRVEKQNYELSNKIKRLEELFDTFSEKAILSESLLAEPPSTKNEDPLTPLDQKFVTFDQLNNHYRTFINRIQQQLATLGGGGEVRLEFLDDVDRETAKVDGKFLKYEASSGKWVGADGGSGGGSQTLNETLGLGNTSSLGMSVGLTTASQLHVGIDTGFFTEELVVNGDARITGILTVGQSSVTIDGVDDKIIIGSGTTITEGGNAEFVGVVTATNVSIANTFTYPEYITGGMVPRAIKCQGGYDRTSAFVDYQTGTEASQDPADYIEYTQDLANSETWYRFGMTTAGNQARDGQWWGETNTNYDQSKGLFGGLTAPAGVDHFFDFSENTAFNNAQTTGSLKYTQALGSFSLKECQVGDLVLARFDFNVMPMVTNTTVQVALIYANRDENDDITFTFPLTITPFFYGSGSVGKGFLLRPTITAYMANQQDVNSRSLVAIKADNPILVNPIGVLFTIQR